MTLQEKTNAYLRIAFPGDIVIFRGTVFISRAIEDITGSWASHCAVMDNISGIPNVIQSTINKAAKGMEVYPFVDEIQGDEDFMVLRTVGFTPQQIRAAIDALQEKIAEKAKYNKLFYLRILLWKIFKWNDAHITQHNAYVCSQAVQLFTDALGITAYRADSLIIPQDFITLRPSNIQILVNKGL